MARPSRGFSESSEIWKMLVLRRGENRSTRRKISRSKDENQQQVQPTFDAESGNRTRATLVGGLHGRQMLNHCAISAPRKRKRPLHLSRERMIRSIGGFHCHHVGGQNKRKFVHIVCIKIEVNSHRRKILLFLSTNMAALNTLVRSNNLQNI